MTDNQATIDVPFADGELLARQDEVYAAVSAKIVGWMDIDGILAAGIGLPQGQGQLAVWVRVDGNPSVPDTVEITLDGRPVVLPVEVMHPEQQNL